MYPTMYRALHRAPLATLKINVPRYSIESETRNRGKKSRSVFVTYSTTIFLASFITPSPLFPFCVRKKKDWSCDVCSWQTAFSVTPRLRLHAPASLQLCNVYGLLGAFTCPVNHHRLPPLISSFFSRGFFDRDTHSVSDDVARGAEGRKERKGKEENNYTHPLPSPRLPLSYVPRSI